MKNGNFKKTALTITLGCMVVLIFIFDLHHYLTLDFLKEKQIIIKNYYASHVFITIYILRDSVQTRFRDKLKTINERLEKDGAFYLFTLRLVPAFPFFAINLLMGLTPMPLSTFFFVSQVGMLAGTFIFVNAGTQLTSPELLSGKIPPDLLIALALLGLFPLVAKKGIEFIKRKHRKMEGK